jgi:hypothetical protein
LGGPLEASINVRNAINRGTLDGATLYVSGPFIQHAAYPGTDYFRWGVSGAADARAKVNTLADAGVDTIKLKERTAQMSLGPFFWTPTIEGLWNYEYMRDHPEMLDDPSWQVGLAPDIVADIKASIQHPDQMSYFQLTPARKPTLKRKFEQLRAAGVTMLVGTDSGIPMQFHSQTTWNELDIWVRELGVPPMEAIRSATYWPSVMMKKDKEVGTITPGKFADIIAVRGDVLRYIDLLQRVDVVVKHGKRYRKDEPPSTVRLHVLSDRFGPRVTGTPNHEAGGKVGDR